MTVATTELIRSALVIALLAGGVFFFFVGTLGLLRLPDVFSRMHATAKSDTLGAGLVLAALAVQYGVGTTALELIVAMIFVAVTSPAANHIMARAAYKSTERRAEGETPDADT